MTYRMYITSFFPNKYMVYHFSLTYYFYNFYIINTITSHHHYMIHQQTKKVKDLF